MLLGHTFVFDLPTKNRKKTKNLKIKKPNNLKPKNVFKTYRYFAALVSI